MVTCKEKLSQMLNWDVATIYIAGRFEDRERLSKEAKELTAMGFKIVSSWLHVPKEVESFVPEREKALEFVSQDNRDMDRADCLIYETTEGGVGHHFELGYMYHRGQPIVAVGPIASIHHFVYDLQFSNWEAFYRWLREEK